MKDSKKGKILCNSGVELEVLEPCPKKRNSTDFKLVTAPKVTDREVVTEGFPLHK